MTDKGPEMRRSFGQLSSVYAPGAFFTFEGGLGACLSRTDPNSDFDRANIGAETERQIYARMIEAIRYWFQRASECTGPDGISPIPPQLCVDESLVPGDVLVLPAITQFEFVLPRQISYVPTPLAFVCRTCNLYRRFGNLKDFEQRSDLELSGNPCPHPKTEARGSCRWRQLDVIFVHWSGHWEVPRPSRYEWNTKSEAVWDPIDSCRTCESRDFELDHESAQIGRWFFRCAKCGATAGIDKVWIQNDKVTLKAVRGAIARWPAQARMEPVSYRASAVFYSLAEQFLIFDQDRQGILRVLEADQRGELESTIARIFGFSGELPTPAEAVEQLARASKNEEIRAYESGAEQLQGLQELYQQAPAGKLRDGLKAAIDKQEAIQQATLQAWIRSGYVQGGHQLPPRLVGVLDERERFTSREDPIRLVIEHEALRTQKLEAGETASGRRSYVRFDRLDAELAPKTVVQKTHQENFARTQMTRLGIDQMGLIREFDLCRFTYGYSRVSPLPVTKKHERQVPVRLNLFEPLRGRVTRPIYTITQANEAFYVRLDELAVYAWLKDIKPSDLPEWDAGSGVSLGASILETAIPFGRFFDRIPQDKNPRTYVYAYTLIHTYSHLFMKTIAENSGLDLGSLGEYLFPANLSFVVYRSGTTMDLGNLSSLWRNENESFLTGLLEPRSLSCGAGSVCTQSGGACPDCLLVPETACIAQNELLSRSVLRGGGSTKEDPREASIRGYLEFLNA
jgi:hypothetical protein